jgi:ADP-ribose pyrophosphatase YjhB (NUDIX family)
MKKNRIRSIVICLFRSNGRILVSEGYDSAIGDHFARPLGGGVEFGEHSSDALAREIREELAVEIENPKLIGVLENIFTYEGEPGHEMVFVYDAEFCDKGLYAKAELPYHEECVDRAMTAHWRSPEELSQNTIRLVPEELYKLL